MNDLPHITPEQWRAAPATMAAIVDFGSFEFEGLRIQMTAIVGSKSLRYSPAFFDKDRNLLSGASC